jgi:hypothetical protein
MSNLMWTDLIKVLRQIFSNQYSIELEISYVLTGFGAFLKTVIASLSSCQIKPDRDLMKGLAKMSRGQVQALSHPHFDCFELIYWQHD